MWLDIVCLCAGLTNPEEFSFTSDEETSEQTMRRAGHHARDQKKLDTLKKKLHTDDECTYVIKHSLKKSATLLKLILSVE